ARWNDIQLVDAWIHVRCNAHAEPRLGKDLARFVAHRRVAAVDHDRSERELREQSGVVQDGLYVAALYPARPHDQARPRFLDAPKIMAAQLARGLVLDHAARA